MVVPVAVHVVEDLEYVRSHRDRSSPVGPSDPIRSGRACPVPYYFAGALLLLGKRRRSVHEP
jgi:hypothetical protein